MVRQLAFIRPTCMCLAFLAIAWLQLGADRAVDPLPLEAKLILNKDTCTLAANAGGEAFRQKVQAAVKGGGMLPAAPEVDMTLELKNTSANAVTIVLDADSTSLNLTLEGPGAISADFRGPMTMEFRTGRQVTIEAGKSTSIPIQVLKHGMRNSNAVYWTEPGEYALKASYTTHRPGQDAGRTTIAAPAVKVTVKKAE
jgi:hypothetical protein